MSTAAPILGIVAGCGPGVGAGHLARQLALAQAWVAGGGSVVLVPGGPLLAGWGDRFAAAGVEVCDPPEVLDADGLPAGCDAWVVDGYDLPDELPGALRAAGAAVAVVDDGGRRGTYDADWVVDQNLGADADQYAGRAPGCRLLLGVRYALLRRDVVAARPAVVPDRTGPPRRLLVAVGGDPPPELEAFADAVASPAVLERLRLERVDLRGVADVGALLASVDLAVTAAGSTVWELAAHGVPSVAVCAFDNQQVVARRAGAAGVVVDGGDLDRIRPEAVVAVIEGLVGDPDQRQALATRAWSAVDGQGARRVAVALRGDLLSLQQAEAADEHLLLGWANDPVVRDQSYSPEPIDADDHHRWLAQVLTDPERLLLVARDHAGHPVGQVRFDRDGDRAVLDYSVAAELRGRGWAAPLVDAGVRRAFDHPGFAEVGQVVAEVVAGNEASARSLVAADFVAVGERSHRGRQVRTYTRGRHG